MHLLFTCRLIVVGRMYRANQKLTNTVTCEEVYHLLLHERVISIILVFPNASCLRGRWDASQLRRNLRHRA